MLVVILSFSFYLVLLKNCPKAEDDYEKLQAAHIKMTELAEYIDETKKKNDSKVKMFQIMESVEDCPVSILKYKVFCQIF